MDTWRPITRSKPEVHGVDERYPGLLRVTIDLFPEPDRAWEQMFNHPTGVGISMSMHPPELRSGTIHLTPPDTELEAYVRHVDERITAANRAYEEQVLPKAKRAHAAEEARKKEEADRIAEARRKAAGL